MGMFFDPDKPIKITVVHKTGPVLINKADLVGPIPEPIPFTPISESTPIPEHIQFSNDLEIDLLYRIMKNETDNQRMFRHAGRDFHRSIRKFE